MGALELMTHLSAKPVRVYRQDHPLRAAALKEVRRVLEEKHVANERLETVDRALTRPQDFGINVSKPPELVDYFALHSPDLSMTSIGINLLPDFRFGYMAKLILEHLGFRHLSEELLASPASLLSQKLNNYTAMKGPVSIALFLENGASVNQQLTAFCGFVGSLAGRNNLYKVGLYVPPGEKEYYLQAGAPRGPFLAQLEKQIGGCLAPLRQPPLHQPDIVQANVQRPRFLGADEDKLDLQEAAAFVDRR
jgi:hypothetical protein